MVHVQHAVHQVEIQAHDAGHAAQLVADQTFFRGAIHVGDAVFGRARAIDGGAGQGRRRAGGWRGRACVLAGAATCRLRCGGRRWFMRVLLGMVVLVIVLVVMLVIVIVAIVRHRFILQDSCMLPLETL
ncbi:hypothetical protein D3C81_1505560 [compost metagenome]